MEGDITLFIGLHLSLLTCRFCASGQLSNLLDQMKLLASVVIPSKTSSVKRIRRKIVHFDGKSPKNTVFSWTIRLFGRNPYPELFQAAYYDFKDATVVSIHFCLRWYLGAAFVITRVMPQELGIVHPIFGLPPARGLTERQIRQ